MNTALKSDLVKRTLGLVLVVAAIGCTQSRPKALLDGENDAVFGTERADTGGYFDGSPAACRILAAANSASFEQLAAAGVHDTVIANIINIRIGDDSVPGTYDDGNFESLTQLDAVPFVGPFAFAALESAGWRLDNHCSSYGTDAGSGGYLGDGGISHYTPDVVSAYFPGKADAPGTSYWGSASAVLCRTTADQIYPTCSVSNGDGPARCLFSAYQTLCLTRQDELLTKLTAALQCVLPAAQNNECDSFSDADDATTCVRNAVGSFTFSQRQLLDIVAVKGCGTTSAAETNIELVPYMNDAEVFAAIQCIENAPSCGDITQCMFTALHLTSLDPACEGL